MKKPLNREELAISCFGMTIMEAHFYLSEYCRWLDEFILNPDNADIVNSMADEISLLKPFISKAQNYISYNRSLVKPVDDYEKSLLEEIYAKLI